VVSASSNSESFFVSADGGSEDIFDTVLNGVYSGTWRWSVINGRGGTNALLSAAGTLNPRVFTFAAGPHTLKFRGRQTNTWLDRFIATDDPNFVPSDPTPQDPAPVARVTLPPNGLAISWLTLTGRVYRILYKSNLTDSQWNAVSPDLPSSGSFLQWVDPGISVNSRRFYQLILLP
jgi:hypothetical protein